MQQTEQLYKTCLQRIANILMINGGFLDNPGLYTGEMGLVLFFFRYARFTQNELYSDYGFDLIEKLQCGMDEGARIGYRQGLTGIGSAIEYLVQNGFVEADTDDILAEFDERIFSECNLPYYSLDELLGIGQYIVRRMSGKSAKKDAILKTVLPKVVHFIGKDCTFDLHDSLKNPARYCLNGDNNPYRLESKTYSRLLEQFTKNDSFDINLGIQNGLAGLGLCLLTALDGDGSWASLFDQDLQDLIKK